MITRPFGSISRPLHSSAPTALADQKKPTLGLSAQALILTCLRPSPKRYDDDSQGSSLREREPPNRCGGQTRSCDYGDDIDNGKASDGSCFNVFVLRRYCLRHF